MLSIDYRNVFGIERNKYLEIMNTNYEDVSVHQETRPRALGSVLKKRTLVMKKLEDNYFNRLVQHIYRDSLDDSS